MMQTKQNCTRKSIIAARSIFLDQEYCYEPENFSYDYQMNRIYEGMRISDGQKVRIKAILKTTTYKENKSANIMNQAELISKINHQNIFKPIKVIPREKSLYLVYPKSNTTLRQFMCKKTLSQDEIFCIWIDILIALYNCKLSGFIHRCVLTNNIILGDNGKWQLTGFQFATTKERKIFCETKKLEHDKCLPPQTLRDHVYIYKSEVWSLGIILYEMLFQKHPFEFVKRRDQIFEAITSKKILIKTNTYHRIFSWLLNTCFRTDPNTRMNFEQILNELYQAKDLPQKFQKILHLKFHLWNNKIIQQEPEYEINKGLLLRIKKESYFMFYINRVLKLLKKSSIQPSFDILTISTQLYLRKMLSSTKKDLLELSQKQSIRKANFNEQIQQILNDLEHLEELYPGKVGIPADLRNDSKYSTLLEEGQLQQIFLLHYQYILRTHIVENIKKVKCYKNQQILQAQYEIYALDFCITCFQIQAEIIGKSLQHDSLWQFITLETLKRISENPFEFRLDSIQTQLIEKARLLRLS